MEFIDLKTQYSRYKKEIDSAIARVLESGHYILGPEVAELEKILADYVEMPHCVTVASGTDSLLIILMALNVGPGDEVITTPFTWISTLEVIKLLGAKARLVDIDPDTYNLNINELATAINPRTKAIMPVSLFGQMPDCEAINTIAKKHNIPVIEDGAQSFGATRNGVRSCGATAFSSTSFFPAKPLGCYGDGGAIFVKDNTMADKMRAIRNHGALQRHHHFCLGLNGRFDTLQAAVLLAKWPHFDKELQARAKIGARYSKLLSPYVKVPKVEKGCTHTYSIYTIQHKDRDHIAAHLKTQGIPTGIYYPVCCHLQPAFADWGYRKGEFPVAEQASHEVISLPMHPWLDEETQDRIVEAVKESLVEATVRS